MLIEDLNNSRSTVSNEIGLREKHSKRVCQDDTNRRHFNIGK